MFKRFKYREADQNRWYAPYDVMAFEGFTPRPGNKHVAHLNIGEITVLVDTKYQPNRPIFVERYE